MIKKLFLYLILGAGAMTVTGVIVFGLAWVATIYGIGDILAVVALILYALGISIALGWGVHEVYLSEQHIRKLKKENKELDERWR